METVRGDTAAGDWRSEDHGGYFIRTREWYYLRYRKDDRDELYNMETDSAQTRDVAESHPRVVKRLRRQIRAWEQEARRSGPASVPLTAPVITPPSGG